MQARSQSHSNGVMWFHQPTMETATAAAKWINELGSKEKNETKPLKAWEKDLM